MCQWQHREESVANCAGRIYRAKNRCFKRYPRQTYVGYQKSPIKQKARMITHPGSYILFSIILIHPVRCYQIKFRNLDIKAGIVQ
jgi:hypothetical protein